MSNLTGKFNVVIHSPVGERKAVLDFIANGTVLAGQLSTDKNVSPIEGTADGDTFDFNAKVPTPLGKMKAHIRGSIEGDTLTATARLTLGESKITGQRAI